MLTPHPVLTIARVVESKTDAVLDETYRYRLNGPVEQERAHYAELTAVYELLAGLQLDKQMLKGFADRVREIEAEIQLVTMATRDEEKEAGSA